MFSRLMLIYPFFTDFFSALNDIFATSIIQALGSLSPGVLNTQKGSTLNATVPTNIKAYKDGRTTIIGAWDMAANIPGSTCFEVGYKTAACIRFLTGIGLNYV